MITQLLGTPSAHRPKPAPSKYSRPTPSLHKSSSYQKPPSYTRSAHSHRPPENGRRTVRLCPTALPLGFASHTFVGSEPIYYSTVAQPSSLNSGYYPAAQPTYQNAPQFGYGSNLPLEVSYQVDPTSELATNEIRFEKNSTSIADDNSVYYLQSLLAALNSPDLVASNFVIEGHASAEGSSEYNRELSQRRANAVHEFLVSQGVSPIRLLSVGHGEDLASYPADAPDYLRASDRRVILYKLAQ